MPTANRKLLRQAMHKLLRPLVALLLKHGLQYRELAEVIKRVYFDVALKQLQQSKGKASVSQLSVLTGLHRKDISDFLELPDASADQEPPSAGAAIIAEWLTRKSYQDDKGQPRALPYVAEGRRISFSALVESVSKDMRPRVYLDEFIRLGLICEDQEGLLHLQGDAFVPKEDFRTKLDFLVRNLSDHFAASSENMGSTAPPHFDRSAFHGNLTADDFAALRTLVDAQGMQLLKDFYGKAETLTAQKDKTDKPTRRVTLGVYLYSEDE